MGKDIYVYGMLGVIIPKDKLYIQLKGKYAHNENHIIPDNSKYCPECGVELEYEYFDKCLIAEEDIDSLKSFGIKINKQEYSEFVYLGLFTDFFNCDNCKANTNTIPYNTGRNEYIKGEISVFLDKYNLSDCLKTFGYYSVVDLSY